MRICIKGQSKGTPAIYKQYYKMAQPTSIWIYAATGFWTNYWKKPFPSFELITAPGNVIVTSIKIYFSTQFFEHVMQKDLLYYSAYFMLNYKIPDVIKL